MPEASRAAIALGSNLGDRERNLRLAIDRMATLGKVVAVSRFHNTAPVGLVQQPDFLNGALLLETRLLPLPLLHGLLGIERAMGRDRATVPAKGPRTIDLDLLLYDQVVLATAELTLPHPAMHDRRFVLEPLAEIAPAWVHPIAGASIASLLCLASHV
jgi:2-amino-4-hydroxy-6-hydroxymethyldihydropteridine diphosphokinase